MRSLGIFQGSYAHLAWLCHELLLRYGRSLVRCYSCAPYWDNEEGFHAIFGLAPRIAAASFIAFICGSFINAYVMSKMKIASNGKNFSLRAILSTVAGESIDSLIFFPLALSSVVPAKELILLMVWQVILKTVYEIIALPITIRVVKALKKYEGEDVYDEGISYGWFKF